MKRKIFYCVLFLMMLCKAEAQLIVSSGGTVFLEVGSVINVQGNLTTNSNIQGTGKISLSGTAAQLNANGFNIPNLDINSAGSIALTGNCIVSTSLNFSFGKIQLGNSQFTLSSSAIITGVSGTKFIETTGNGLVKKELASNGNYTIPVGANNQYMPLSYTVSAGSFGAGAFLGTQLLNAVHPNKPRSIRSLLRL